MEEIILPQIQVVKEKDNYGCFVIQPLYPGYGQTVANSLRRVLLSSLEGAAVSKVKIEGASHEFSALKGVKEDVVEIILNLKELRVKMFGSEPVTLTLNVKGPKKVKAKDFKVPSQIEIKNPQLPLATLDNEKARLKMEVVIDRGRGYVPVEMKPEDPEIGVIQVDSLYSPVKWVNYKVEHTRVGQRTDYDKIRLEIKTDETIAPSEALKKAVEILVKQFEALLFREDLSRTEDEGQKKTAKKKRSKKSSS